MLCAKPLAVTSHLLHYITYRLCPWRLGYTPKIFLCATIGCMLIRAIRFKLLDALALRPANKEDLPIPRGAHCTRVSSLNDLNPLLAPGRMSPYVVPDHVLERKFPTALTPTFWTGLTIVPFDTHTHSPKATMFLRSRQHHQKNLSI